jgi:hypothetical protein
MAGYRQRIGVMGFEFTQEQKDEFRRRFWRYYQYPRHNGRSIDDCLEHMIAVIEEEINKNKISAVDIKSNGPKRDMDPQ